LETFDVKKLGIDEIKTIATQMFKAKFNLDSLSPQDRRRLAVGYTVEGNVGVCSYYVPAPLPQEGRLLAEVKVDRITGGVISVELP
jgi:hypothetical protein